MTTAQDRLQQQSRSALGTDCILTVVTEAPDILAELWQRIEVFNQCFSRFLPTSELTHVNQLAGQCISVTKQFNELLTETISHSKRTQNVFNPSILPALQRAGYVASWTDLPLQPGTDFRAQEHVTDLSKIRMNQQTLYLPSNMALDFGGIGKGYLLDQLADFLESENYDNYWLSLGGDIVASGAGLDGFGWQLTISDAVQPKTAAATIYTNGQRIGLATSGVTKRRGWQNGREWHHLIDPQTGQPATTNVLTASAVCQSATDADILAKYMVLTDGIAVPGSYEPLYRLVQRIDQSGVGYIQEGSPWM